MSKKIRTIFYQPAFEDAAKAIEQSFDRWDDAVAGVEMFIARCPERGKRTSNPDIRAVTTTTWSGLPLVFYYSFDDDHVVMEMVTPADERED